MASGSDDALVAVVREAMRVEAGGAPQPIDWTVTDSPDFVEAVKRHRVAGLLVTHSGVLSMPDNLAQRVHELAVAEAHGGLLLTGRTLEIVDILNRAGIAHLVMKGVALSVLTTGRSAGRGAGDVDLLVGERDVIATHLALRAVGFSRSNGFDLVPGAWWTMTRWLARELPYRRGGGDIDLHWRVAYHEHLFPPTSTLLTRGQTIGVEGRSVRTLSDADTLASSCFHAYFDRYGRLRSLVDVLRLSRVAGVAMPFDASPPLRRLVGDSLAFVTSLIGDQSDLDRWGTKTGSEGTIYARHLWERSAASSLWYEGITPLRDFGDLYRHQARYGSRAPSLARFAAGRVLLIQDLDPGDGLAGIAKSAAAKARSIMRHRLGMSV